MSINDYNDTSPAAVHLYMYDISGGLAARLGPMLLGFPVEAIWHTAIVFRGNEYLFGGGGVESDPPGQTRAGTPLRTVRLGTSTKSKAEFESWNKASTVYTPNSYNLLSCNCNSYSNDAACFLCGDDVDYPADVRGMIPKLLSTPLGSMVRPMLENMEGLNGQGGGGAADPTRFMERARNTSTAPPNSGSGTGTGASTPPPASGTQQSAPNPAPDMISAMASAFAGSNLGTNVQSHPYAGMIGSMASNYADGAAANNNYGLHPHVATAAGALGTALGSDRAASGSAPQQQQQQQQQGPATNAPPPSSSSPQEEGGSGATTSTAPLTPEEEEGVDLTLAMIETDEAHSAQEQIECLEALEVVLTTAATTTSAGGAGKTTSTSSSQPNGIDLLNNTRSAEDDDWEEITVDGTSSIPNSSPARTINLAAPYVKQRLVSFPPAMEFLTTTVGYQQQQQQEVLTLQLPESAGVQQSQDAKLKLLLERVKGSLKEARGESNK